MQPVESMDAKRKVGGKNKKYPSLLDDLLKLGGDATKIIMPPELARFVGSHKTAMMLSQILYWQPRTNNKSRRIFKSDLDWQKELHLPRYSVRQSRAMLEEMGIIHTHIKKAKGAPTTHYQCDWEYLNQLWAYFMSVPREAWKENIKQYKGAVKARTPETKSAKRAVARRASVA